MKLVDEERQFVPEKNHAAIFVFAEVSNQRSEECLPVHGEIGQLDVTDFESAAAQFADEVFDAKRKPVSYRQLRSAVSIDRLDKLGNGGKLFEIAKEADEALFWFRGHLADHAGFPDAALGNQLDTLLVEETPDGGNQTVAPDD